MSLPLLLKLALLAQLRAAAGATASPPSSTSSYHPTPGAEDRWVAEEEFQLLERRRDGMKEEGRGRDPRSSSYPGHEAVAEPSWWDEDDGDDEGGGGRLRLRPAPSSTAVEERKSAAAGKKRHRLRIWKNGRARENEDLGGRSTSASSGDGAPTEPLGGGVPPPTTSGYDEEHPMRTDEWRLDVRLSRLYSEEEGELFPECYVANGMSKRAERAGVRRKRQVMQFARNGYVRVSEEGGAGGSGGAGRNRPLVGKWRIGHGGVAFDIPVQVNARRKRGGGSDGGGGPHPRPRTTVLHYHADIHLNKFGERPRMFRGVITRDR